MTEENNLELTVEQINGAFEANPELKQAFTPTFLNKEAVTGYLETEDGKAITSPMMDSYASKAIEGWKSKNIESIVQQRVAELHPPETVADKQMAEMRVRLENIEQEKNKLELRSVASSELTRVGLGTEFLDFITGDTPETIRHRASALEVHIQNLVQSSTDTKIASIGAQSSPSNSDTAAATAGKKMSDYTASELGHIMNTNPVLGQQIMDRG